jgi:uncharacterized membrane protein HdeD (DUF308 family)
MEVAKNDNLRGTRLLLKWTFVLLPIIAGLDKFTYILVEWEKYLLPLVKQIIPGNVFMMIVGVIEIIAGLIVYFRPKIGSIIVMIWLLCIAVNLILTGNYDIAVRDIVIAIAAYTLHRLS